MSNLRIENGLPRGGIGYLSIATVSVSLLVAALVEPDTALLICIPTAVLTTWLAIGLRFDYESGEAVDEIATDDEESWLEWVCGIAPTTSLWRISTWVIISSLGAIGLATWRLMP